MTLLISPRTWKQWSYPSWQNHKLTGKYFTDYLLGICNRNTDWFEGNTRLCEHQQNTERKGQSVRHKALSPQHHSPALKLLLTLRSKDLHSDKSNHSWNDTSDPHPNITRMATGLQYFTSNIPLPLAWEGNTPHTRVLSIPLNEEQMRHKNGV